MPLRSKELRLVAMNFLEASQDFVYGISRKADETKVETILNRVLQKVKGKKLSEVGSIRFGVRGGNPTLVTLGRFIMVAKETQDVEEIKKRMEKLTKDDESGKRALETLVEKLEEVNETCSAPRDSSAEDALEYMKVKEDHSHQRSTFYRVKNDKLIIEFREKTPGWGSADFVFDLSEKTLSLKSSKTEPENYKFSQDLDMNKLEYVLNHCDRGSALERFFLRASMEGSLKNFNPSIDPGTLDDLFKSCKQDQKRKLG
ncbi:MAG: hypothetical protein ACI9S8_002904 [Chlamydiales bacterium]|jgi:hypothetical protein